MVGRQKLSGKQEEIRFKVSLSLCKHVDPAAGSIRNRLKAYAEIVQELAQLGVSPRYMLVTFGGITRTLQWTHCNNTSDALLSIRRVCGVNDGQLREGG